MFPELAGNEKTVYDVLVNHPEIGTDEIRDLCGLPLPQIATALLSLELKSLCRCLPGKIYKVN
jgi:predicted Rossmann fold nucleotide-binding protein DprA/Smf involved in DNA uptake